MKRTGETIALCRLRRLRRTELPVADPAGHAFRGQTRRNASAAGQAGSIYLGAQGGWPRRCKLIPGKMVWICATCNVDRKLRFYERGNPYVSGPKRLRE